jgi:hypothetical protein
MITSVRVIWLVDEEKKHDIYVLGEKKRKENAVAMSGIRLMCVGNDDG